VQFYGGWDDTYAAYVEDLGLDDVVSYEGFLPHDEIVPVLRGSDLLL
jgi:glycosyltransferase involved in cell wall biosynthesis